MRGLVLTLVMSPVDSTFTCSKRRPRLAVSRSLIAQRSWTNADWLSMFIVAPRVAM